MWDEWVYEMHDFCLRNARSERSKRLPRTNLYLAAPHPLTNDSSALLKYIQYNMKLNVPPKPRSKTVLSKEQRRTKNSTTRLVELTDEQAMKCKGRTVNGVVEKELSSPHPRDMKRVFCRGLSKTICTDTTQARRMPRGRKGRGRAVPLSSHRDQNILYGK